MTNQELFDTVVAHLGQQRAKSIGDAGFCLYRGPNGLKCAIGCLIPDARYSPDLECEGAHSTLVRIAAGLEWQQVDLAHDLQCVHDDWPVEQWPDRLRKCADRFDLNPGSVEASFE